MSALSSTLGNVNIEDAIIGNLQVGRHNIETGAVTEYALFDQGGVIDVRSSAMTTIAEVTVEHGLGSPNVELLYGYNVGIVTAITDPAHVRQLFEVVETGEVFIDRTGNVGNAASALVSPANIRVKNYSPPADRATTTFRISIGNRGTVSHSRANYRLLRAFVMKR